MVPSRIFERIQMSKKAEPLIAAIRKARAEHKKTPEGVLGELFRERSKWTRRATIARNKIQEVQDRLDAYAQALATEAQNRGADERKG
jgi:hypothetical protein